MPVALMRGRSVRERARPAPPEGDAADEAARPRPSGRSLAGLLGKAAIGIVVEEHELIAVRAGISFGVRALDRVSVVPEGETADEALRRLLELIARRKGWHGLPIAVGLSPRHLFFTTRPIRATSLSSTPQALLHEVLRSPSIDIDEMAIAIQKTGGKQPLASLVACRKKYLATILDAFQSAGKLPYQVEPLPCALVRLAEQRRRAPRSATTAVRVFLGDGHGLAVLTSQGRPLLWRAFVIREGNWVGSIRAAYRSIQGLSRFVGVEQRPGALLIHGRPELTRGLGEPSLSIDTIPTLVFDGPAFDPEAAALGLALGCLPETESLNLAPESRPPVPISRQIPWTQLAIQAGLILGLSARMNSQWKEMQEAQAILATEQQGLPWMKDTTLPKLQEESKALTGRIDTIRHFLTSQVHWTNTSREITTSLPPTLTLTSFGGSSDYAAEGAKGGGAKTLTLGVEAIFPEDGPIPREVDDFVAALRKKTSLKQTMPSIEMGGLTFGAAERSTGGARATFQVTCKSVEAGKKAGGKAGGGG
ncbi:MAG: hypothetical protein U0800_05150 [Isosphaeraceae bacterium]